MSQTLFWPLRSLHVKQERNKYKSNFNIRLKISSSFLPCPCLPKCNLSSLLPNFPLNCGMGEQMDICGGLTASVLILALVIILIAMRSWGCAHWLVRDYWVLTVCQAPVWLWGLKKQCSDKIRHCVSDLTSLHFSLTLCSLFIWVTGTSRNWHIPWNLLPETVKPV